MEARHFEIAGLAPDNCATPTGMRDELLLISWLIVLMRIQESSQVRFEWKYNNGSAVLSNGDSIRSLSPHDVTIGMQSHAGQATANLSGMIPLIKKPQQIQMSEPASLYLSSGSLSRTSDQAKDEVGVHLVNDEEFAIN